MSPYIETETVNVKYPDGSIVEGEFSIWGADPNDSEYVRLDLTFDGQQIVASRKHDYFDALCEIRQVLEHKRIWLDCYGSSLNVWPSGMSRSMGGGIKAYRMQIGKHAEITSLVSIFDTGPDVRLATVEEQAAFFDQWQKSIVQ